MTKWEKDHIGQKEEQERNEDKGLQMYVSSSYVLTIQGVIRRLAMPSPESLVEVQNIKPHADLLNQNLYFNKITK